MINLNVFDFDKTIYDGDSTVDFYKYSLKRNIKVLKYLPMQFWFFILFIFKVKEKVFFKEKFYTYFKEIKDIDKLVEEFWLDNAHKIKKWYLDGEYKNVVIISASPEFLLKPICDRLNILKLIGSIVDKKTGKYTGENCYGNEKVNRLNKEYNDYIIDSFYSDSLSDKYLAKIANKRYLVKKDKIIDWNL